MVRFLGRKIRLTDVFYYGLALYPILKFNLSSFFLIALLIVIVLKSYKDRKIDTSKKKIKAFFLFTFFFFLLCISISYSYDKEDAFKKITRLIPILIIPGVLLFCKPQISLEQRTRILKFYLFTNLIYILILFCVYKISVENSLINNFSFVEALSHRNEFQQILDEFIGIDVFFIHKAYFSMGFVFLAIFSLQQVNKSIHLSNMVRILYTTFFLFFSFLIFSVFSFPNVIALIISTIVVYLYNNDNSKRSKRLIVVITITIISTSAWFYYKYNDIDVKRGLNFIESIFVDKEIELNDPRIEIYANINSLYKKASINEILFGYGIGDVDSVLNNESNLRLSKSSSKNLLLFSEEFNDDYWHKNNIEVIQNKKTSPINTLKADVLREKTTDGISSFNISRTIKTKTLETLTFSVYAQEGSSKDLILRMGNINNRVVFNLEEGTYKTFNSNIVVRLNKIGEWYRCSITSQVNDEFLIIIGLSNRKKEYKYKGNEKEIYLWGAQLEKGNSLTTYENKNTELLTYIADGRLNSHNNYLYFLLSAGVLGLFSFLLSLITLFCVSFRNKNVYQITFCIIIAVNFLTENILSRHWGLVYISFMLLVFFSYTNKGLESETKKNIL